ncbi:hypothetical protein LMH87_005295 [Akanthomyces muscarius]|uniref:Amidohydrolase-related domain-containing protein n=1 Tax=Akanthomyces muscarius TaxID=2231603 RepID=A0A9W8QL33_AKAMU|nr:hypothetical protein LMH87_005295 [Akanthomyces muscarius]KAJ4163574.1 hypothetical protein LMH87_005295 [Akanthomyces muscarius]
MTASTHSEVIVFTHATIITQDSQRTIWLDAAIVTKRDRIIAIGKTAQLVGDGNALPSNARFVDCSGRVIIPGLVNTHAHAAQSLLRGLAEDVPLHSWLCDAVWPLEAQFDGDDGYVAAKLTIAEMLKSGTTCFLEAMLTHRTGFENVAKAVEEMGIRACLGKLVKATDPNLKDGLPDPRDIDAQQMSMDAMLAAHAKHDGSCGGRLQAWVALGTPRGSSEAAYQAIGDKCERHSLGITMHCAEAPKDRITYHEAYDCSPVEFCKRTKLIGPGRKAVLAHMVNLDLDTDLALLRETGATVSHNPASNCKLGSGIAAVPQMLEAGVHVALGTDGAPCNNTYDMFREMRLAGLLHSGVHNRAGILPAEDLLAMATIRGAESLGLDKDIGSLEVGKKADFVILEATTLGCAPFDSEQILAGGFDPVTAVVYSCTEANVESVVIDGQILVENHALVGVSEQSIILDAKAAIQRIRKRSNFRTASLRNYR